MQRALLALVLVALSAGLVALGVHFLRSDRAEPGAVPPAGRADGGSPGAALAPTADEVRTVSPEDAGADAAGARAAAAERPAVDPAQARWLEVVAALPEGTPPDEALVAWAFSAEPDVGDLADDLDRADAPGQLARAAADEEGRLRLALPDDAGDVWVYVRGRYAYGKRAVRARAGDERADVALALGAWIRGRVRLPAGASADDVAGTRVTLRRNPMRQRASYTIGVPVASARRTTVAEDLSFEVGGVVPETGWRLEMVPDALAAVTRAKIDLVPAQALDLPLPLATGATLAGRVVDGEGQGVAGASVTVQQEPLFFGVGGVDVRAGETDADGAFALAAVRAGSGTLVADADGYLQAELDVDVPDGGALADLVVRISSGAAISGTVRWPDGSPAAGADVRVSFDVSQAAGMGGFNAMRGAEGRAEAGADGAFRVTGLGPGPFTVRASAPRSGEGADLAVRAALEDLGYAADPDDDWTARADGVAPDTEGLALELAAPEGLAGRVVDADGDPVEEFRVRAALLPEGGNALPGMMHETRSETVADPAGRFRLAGTDPGRWQVSVDADGFASSEPTEVQVPQDPEGAGLVVELARELVVSGTVLDPDGVPVAGAVVAPHLDMSAMIQVATGQRQNPTAESDERGAFRLGGLAAGELTIVARAEGRADSPAVPVAGAPGEEVADVVLRLRRGATITGEVYRANGDPAAGVSVIVQTTVGRNQRILTAETDGTFAVHNLTPDDYQVIAMLQDLGEIELDRDDAAASSMKMLEKMKFQLVSVADEEEVHVVLGAPPAFPVELSGAVTVDGVAVPSALLQFVSHGAGGLSALKMATTDEGGRYAVTLDEAGGYLVTITKTDGVGLARQQIEFTEEVPREDTARIDFELPVASVSGRVRGPGGRPVSNVRVTLASEGGVKSGTFLGGHYADTTTNADGEYEIGWVPEGTYTVAAGGSMLGGLFGASGAEYGRQVRRGLEVAEAEAVRGVDFRLVEPAALAGVVVDGAGQPVEGAAIFLRTEDGALLERFSMIATDAAGRFEYAGLEPAVYRVGVRGKGYASTEDARVRVEAGEPAEVRLVADPGVLLVVSLVDADGAAVQARITVEDDEGRQVNGMVSLADIMAAFQSGDGLSLTEERVGPLAPGRYRVTAVAPDGRTASRLVTLRAGQDEKKTTLKLKD